MFQLQSRSMDLKKKPTNQNILKTKISINCEANPNKYNETTQNRLSRNPPIYYYRNVSNPYKYNIQSVDLKYSHGRSNEEIFTQKVKDIINKESGGSITLDDIISKSKKDKYIPYGYPYFDYVNRHPNLMKSTNFLTSRRKFNMDVIKKNNSMGNGERKLCITTSPYITNNKNGNDNYEGPINGPFDGMNYGNEEQKNYEVENNRYENNENVNQMNVNDNNTNEDINQNNENQNMNNNNITNEPIVDKNINNNNTNEPIQDNINNNNNNNIPNEPIVDKNINNNNTNEPTQDNINNNNNIPNEPIVDNNINNNNINEPTKDNNLNNNIEQPIKENENNIEQNKQSENMNKLDNDNEEEYDEFTSQFNYNNQLQYKYNNYTTHHDPKKITRPLNLYPQLSEKDQIQYKYYESDPHLLKDDEFFKKKSGEKNLFRNHRQLQDFENKLHMTGESKSSWIPRIPQRTTYNNLTSVKYNILSPNKKSIFKTHDEITGIKIGNRVKSISDFVDVNRIAAENLSELFTNSIKDKNWFNRTEQVATNQADLHNTYRERIPYPFS